MQTLYILQIDRHQLGDSLFLKSLAQQLARGKSGDPACLLVHGSGEKVERTLESQGVFPDREEGVVQVETAAQARLVERAVREMNQEIVAALTDEVVSTVGIQGVDRSLLARAEDGSVTANSAGWLSALVKQRVVPVVSALVGTESGPAEEVRPAAVTVALAHALASSFDPVACFLTDTDRPGIQGEDEVQTEVAIDDVTSEHVSDVESVRQISDEGIPVLVTNVTGLLGGDRVRGTRIRPAGRENGRG